MTFSESDEFPLNDSLDAAIIMHRDVHFGGKFDIMIDYYEKEGKGVLADFNLNRIKELQLIEQGLGQNLATIMLSGPEAERIAQAKEGYKRLRSLYEKESVNDETSRYPRLVADLILSEDDEPESEIAAVVAEKSGIVPALLKVIESEDYYDPLFPGYGYGPELATKCLGLIGDKRAIISLFESIGSHDFMQESLALDALEGMGEPAKAFLLHVLHAKPITYDNERAAMALLSFKDHPEVVDLCFTMLKEIDLKKHPILATHLALVCEGLQDPKARQELLDIAERPGTPSMLRQDIRTIAHHWSL